MKAMPIVAMCAAALLVAACGKKEESAKSAPAAAAVAPPTQLQKTDIVKGTGEGISLGQVAVVHYTGWLYDPNAPEQKGAKFDSSRDRGQPFPFTLGAGEVIRGWDEGVQGMQAGGQRRLVIPADLAYGESGKDPIPPDATLVFDVELLAIQQPNR
jgi:FKBP-type peptidyl-prolyl cis-trans isomerase FkpA